MGGLWTGSIDVRRYFWENKSILCFYFVRRIVHGNWSCIRYPGWSKIWMKEDRKCAETDIMWWWNFTGDWEDCKETDQCCLKIEHGQDIHPSESAVVLTKECREVAARQMQWGPSGVPGKGIAYQCKGRGYTGQEDLSGQCAASKMCDSCPSLLRME